MLTTKQQCIIDEFNLGKNIFISGAGGTGKSFLISKLIEENSRKAVPKVISVTATTGTAAVLLHHEARTLNQWAGIGIADAEDFKVIQEVYRNKKKLKNWKETDILIVDEVSMMSKRIFDILDNTGKIIRQNQQPFGGIQVVFSGDFYQLPPVGDSRDGSKDFCFESSRWMQTFQNNQFILKQNFRQNDDVYAKILSQIRKGNLSKQSYEKLMECTNKSYTSDILPVKLYPIKSTVDKINRYYNEKIKTTSYKYKNKLFSMQKNKIVNEILDADTLLKKNNKQTSVLELKVGSQVMCTINLDMEHEKKIINGSSGVIIDFAKHSCNPIVKFHNGRVLEMQRQTQCFEYNDKAYQIDTMPLILCWAMTIHKSQGCTLDIAEIDIGSDVFEAGQTYVALSRVRSLKGLYLKVLDICKIKTKKKVKMFYESIKNLIHATFRSDT